MAKILERQELQIPKQADVEKATALADKAYDLLGYRGPLVSKKVIGQLGLKLAELHIKPFNYETVTQYKRSQAKAARTEKRKKLPSAYYRITVRWELVALDGYLSEVPEFALRKAIQVKEAMPEATFFVDELRVNTKRIDPFLVVAHKGEKYWIEVWNEKKFEDALIDGE